MSQKSIESYLQVLIPSETERLSIAQAIYDASQHNRHSSFSFFSNKSQFFFLNRAGRLTCFHVYGF